MTRSPVEFETLRELDKHLESGAPLTNCVFQGLDLQAYTEHLVKSRLTGSVFLGCILEPTAAQHATEVGAVIFPTDISIPYNPYRSSLYSIDDLYAGYKYDDPESYRRTFDYQVYNHFMQTGHSNPPSILESLYRRLHDHAISDSLHEELEGRKVVALMGGHKMRRDEPNYLSIARISRELTRLGYLLVSGGGPGAMEAVHLGAWFASRIDEELEEAVHILRIAPLYSPQEQWLKAAFAVREKFPIKDTTVQMSIGIPTWHYGHEPPNVFATAIAKYFANSEREDGLLAIAKYGVIFAPGSAGTIQEIFQDAAQNHYAQRPQFASPMVFFGESYWKWRKPVFPLLAQLASGEKYSLLLAITDHAQEVVERIKNFNPPVDA